MLTFLPSKFTKNHKNDVTMFTLKFEINVMVKKFKQKLKQVLISMSSDIRWRVSRELKTSLYKNHISGKHVLDIGTRSGENAIMMLNSMHAASVTAIDITSSEFPSETCGVTFVKSSIQEFAKDTDLTYDTVTVFLWNIPFLEYDSCMSAINKILKPNGHIIIGIAEDVYVNPMDNVSIAKLLTINKYYNYAIYHSGKLNKYIVYAVQSTVRV